MNERNACAAVALLFALAALTACASSDIEPPPDGSIAQSSSSGSGGAGGTGGGHPGPSCGDGAIASSESCDDANAQSGDGCTMACEVEEGWSCTGAPSHCEPICGDGLVTGKEACDDGNDQSGDGCTGACTVGLGWSCAGMPSHCDPVCGDGLVVGQEECDDGNLQSGDGCSAACKQELSVVCGDGKVAPGETCDDGNAQSGDGCSSACQIEDHWFCAGMPSVCVTVCGDGFLRGGEACDDGNAQSGDGCSSTCAVELGWSCMGEPSACVTGCGDGVVAGAELCDDGNTQSNDGCNAVCKTEPGWICDAAMPTACSTTCGDGYPAGLEACDDGNLVNGDGCSSACKIEHGYGCFNIPSLCAPICGDGLIGGAETCDDANLLEGDGCTGLCTIEPGHVCAGEPSLCSSVCGDGIVVAGEGCDDHNLLNGDCCSSACTIEAGCEIEVNDNQGLANLYASIAVGNLVKGFINPGADVDYYQLTFVLPPEAPAGSITASTLDGFVNSLCFNSSLDSAVTIYSAAGGALAGDNDSGPGLCSTATAVGVTAGTYYVAVSSGKAVNPTPFDYTLQVTTQVFLCGNGVKDPGEQCEDGNLDPGDGCSPTCHFEGNVVNEIEPNNSYASADQSALQITGDTLIAGAIDILLDKDFYRINLAAPQVVRFETFETMSRDCPTIATHVQLYSAQHAPGVNDFNSGIGQCSALVIRLAAGVHYVSVEKAAGVVIPFYLLEVKVQADLGAEVEPNTPQALATPVSGSDVYLYGDHQIAADSDYYLVNVPQGKSLRAEVIEGDLAKTCESNNIASSLTVYDAGGVALVADAGGGRGLCSLIDGTGSSPQAAAVHALAGGDYYLELRSLAAGPPASFNYRLALTVR